MDVRGIHSSWNWDGPGDDIPQRHIRCQGSVLQSFERINEKYPISYRTVCYSPFIHPITVFVPLSNTSLIQHTLLRLLDTLLLHSALLVEHALLRLQHTLLFHQALFFLHLTLLLLSGLFLLLFNLSSVLRVTHLTIVYVEDLQHQQSEADTKGQTDDEQEDTSERRVLVQVEIRLVRVLLFHQNTLQRIPRTEPPTCWAWEAHRSLLLSCTYFLDPTYNNAQAEGEILNTGHSTRTIEVVVLSLYNKASAEEEPQRTELQQGKSEC